MESLQPSYGSAVEAESGRVEARSEVRSGVAEASSPRVFGVAELRLTRSVSQTELSNALAKLADLNGWFINQTELSTTRLSTTPTTPPPDINRHLGNLANVTKTASLLGRVQSKRLSLIAAKHKQ